IYHGDSGDLESFTSYGGSGAYVSPTGFNATLSATTGTLTDSCTGQSYAYLLTFGADGSKRYFNSAGKLIAEPDASNHIICLSYWTSGACAGLLNEIIDTQGRHVVFHWQMGDIGYRVDYFTAPGSCSGGTCTYTYAYSGGDSDSAGQLTSFTDPTVGTTTYG